MKPYHEQVSEKAASKPESRLVRALWVLVLALACAGSALHFALPSTAATPATSAPPSSPATALARSSPRTHGDLASSRGPAFVRGVVRAEGGEPIAGASLCVTETFEACCAPERCTVSDARGRFALGRERGAARLLASAPGFVATSHALAELRDETLDGGDAEVALVLGAAEVATVTGRVVDASGGAVAGALVVARGAEAASAPDVAALSDRDGSFRLVVKAGPAELSAQAEAYSRMLRRIEAPARDVTLVLVAGSVVSGRVVTQGAGEPIEAARIMAINVNGALLPGVETTSRADGSFEFSGLPAGGYTLWARAEGYQDRREHVVLAVGDSAAVTLGLLPGAVLHASVSAAGRPCDGASLLLDGPVAASAVAAVEGKLSIYNAAPGRYRASVTCANALPHEEELELTARAPLTRHFELASGLTLRGRVERANGQPFASAPVLALPVGGKSDAAAPGVTTERAASSNGCAADAAGAFACAGLQAGVYDVFIEGQGRERSPRVRVALRTGAEPAILLRAHASGTIRASVAGPAGAHAVVLAVREGFAPGAAVLHGAAREGRFVFDDVELGGYRVHLGSAEGASARATLERDGQELDIEIKSPERCSISGSVVDEAGVSVPDAWVRAESADDFTHASVASATPVLSDTAGAFVIPGLFDGKYQLNANNGVSEVTLTSVRCATSGSAGVRLVLSSAAPRAER